MKLAAYLKVFPLFFLLVLIFYAFASDISVVVRYDKYEMFYSLERILFATIVFIFLYCILKVTSVSFLGTLYPTNLFLILLLLLVLPGVLLTSNFENHGTTSFYGYLISLVLFLCGLLISHITSKRLLSHTKGNIKTYSSKSTTFRLMLILFIFGFFISAINFDYSNSVFSSISLFLSSGEVSRKIADLRQIAPSRNFVDIFYAYSLRLFMPIACSFVLLNGVLRKKRNHILLGITMVLIIGFLAASSGGRLSLLFFALYLLASYSMISPISLNRVLNVSSLMLWFLILQTIGLGRISSASKGLSFLEIIIISLNRLVERIFLTKGYVTQKTFEYIPEYSNYKNGETFLTTILGQTSKKESFAQEMFAFVYGGGSQGTAGPQSFGEAYANFGLAGMFLISFILGLLVHKSTRFVQKHHSLDPFKISFLAYFTVLVARIGYGNFFTFKSNGLHILILLLFFFLVSRKLLNHIKLTHYVN